ncbi:MAG: hypothetical protein ACRD1K_16085, partial [Acidimicrobiales bacterium]
TVTTVPGRPVRLGWQRVLFLSAVLSAFALIGLNGLLLVQSGWFSGILNQNVVSGAASHFKALDHRIHDITFGLLYGTGAVGLLTQLRSPRANVGGLFTALIPWAALGLIFPLTNYWEPFGTDFQLYATAVYGGFTLSAVLLHPAGRDLLRSFERAAVNRAMLGMMGAAAVPLLVFTAANVSRQREVASGDIHWQLGHYGFMAALGLTILAVGVVASLRPAGWRVSAWVAGPLPAVLGFLSLAYRDQKSSLGVGWALLSIAWDVAFVAVAERSKAGEDHPVRTPSAAMTPGS